MFEDIVCEPPELISAALQQAERLLEAARSEPGAEALATALVRVARLRFRLGQYATAQALAAEALGVAPSRSPVRAEAWQVLGNCAADTEALAQAEAYYRTAADIARETGHHRAQVAALQGLAGGAYFPRGQFDLALAAANEARRLILEHAHLDLLLYPQTILALIYQVTGQRQKAQVALDELDPLVTPGSIAQGYHLCISADLSLEGGDRQAARALYERTRAIAEASGEPWLNCAVRLGMSRYHRMSGDGPNARAWADDALAFAGRLGFRHEQAKALIERARAAWLCHDETAAENDLRAAVDILQELGAAFDRTRALFLLAALLYQQNHPSAADAWAAAARAIVEGGYAFILERERALAFPLLAAYQNSPDPTVAQWSAILLAQLCRVPPPPLRVATLGGLAIWQGGHRLQDRALRQRRAGELLALLLLTPGHSLTAEQVAEMLFPEKASDAAQVLFHHATSALRRALEPDLPPKFPSRYLEVEEGQITLALPPDSWADFEAFEEHCHRGEWEEALALYGGDLLPEYRYAEWAMLPRERLALLYQRALLGAAGERLTAGRFAEALDACLQCLALEPWQEQAVLIGMHACMGLNDRAGALRLYRDLEQSLRADLNAAPSPGLQSLYRALTR